MYNPLVSVIIPVYNAEETIEKAINSIINNTYSNIEIICINDGSTDNSLKKVQQLAEMHKNIKYFNQSNQGVSAARNLGLDNASGKYVMFVDADDLIKNNTISVCINYLEENQADIICFNMTEDAVSTGKRMLVDGYFSNYLSILYAAEYPFAVNFTNAAVSIIKKEFLNRHKIYFVSGHIYEDWIFMVNVFTKNPYCIFLNEPFYVYCRINPQSITSSVSNSSLDIFDSYRLANELIYSNLLNSNWLFINDRKLIIETFNVFVTKVIKSTNREIIEKFFNEIKNCISSFNIVYIESLIFDILLNNGNENIVILYEYARKNKKVSYSKLKYLKHKKLLIKRLSKAGWHFIVCIYCILRGIINK